ncbi:hypothetical protein O181_111962 [Austropuccinia psidii MF-1]|uniref:Uncharacterized protein n=1 Tax=Austropuccinia psidii MF-1 TaxID=1389203 RepID=A0A9Q3K0V6_9BASI|nr:hypothetical protein [Austropuccinia psidii MF-1]
MRPFARIKLIYKNAVEVRLAEKFSRKNPVFPKNLVKTYLEKGEERSPLRNKTYIPQDIVEVEGSPGPVKKIIRKIRLNGTEERKYLVIFNNQTEGKNKCLGEYAIKDGNLNLGRFRPSRRAEKSHQ